MSIIQRACEENEIDISLRFQGTYIERIDGLSEFDHLTLRVTEQIVLAQLVFNQSHRQSGRIDRNIQLPQHIRKCSDMILMTMRNHKALYPIRIFL